MRFSFSPEQFAVREITSGGVILEFGKAVELGDPADAGMEKDYFSHFILEKRGWNTTEALGAVAHALHAKPSRFNFAGTKDRNSASTQLCSAFAVPPERLAGLKLKDLQINGAWKARKKVTLGDLSGNNFEITLTKGNCGAEPDAEKILLKAQQNRCLFPNLFGAQRFGMRGNTAQIGALMLKGEFHKAVMEYLCGGEGERDESALKARAELLSSNDFAAALEKFPYRLRFERTLLAHLKSHPTDFIGAMRKLPRTLQLMFIHAYESRLFNEKLALRMEQDGGFVQAVTKARGGDFFCAADAGGFPTEQFAAVEDIPSASALAREGKIFLASNLIGSESRLSADESVALEKDGLGQDAFNIKSMPELSCKGALRTLAVPMRDFHCHQDGASVLVQFSLPPGAYATSALEFLLG